MKLLDHPDTGSSSSTLNSLESKPVEGWRMMPAFGEAFQEFAGSGIDWTCPALSAITPEPCEIAAEGACTSMPDDMRSHLLDSFWSAVTSLTAREQS